MTRWVALAVAAVFLAGCSMFGNRSGTEQPAYQVLESLGEGMEVRRYAARLAAEVEVAADDAEDGRNAAFRLLFKYITGSNRAQTEIAMTAPVETEAAGQETEGQEIAMTAPVETVQNGAGTAEKTRTRFFLPASFTPESAPQPTDDRVRLVTVPAETLAVVRFSGSWSNENFAAEESRLLAALEDTPWRAAAPPVAFRYDPPWTLSFLRRNEVAVLLAER